jgi:uncharacterized membrane protein
MRTRPKDHARPRQAFATMVCVSFVLLLASDASAQATANRIDICNKGNTTIAVASVQDRIGLLSRRGELSNVHDGAGWWRIEPGNCEQVFFATEWASRLAWFAFAYTDQQGTFGLANVRPTRGAGWRSSNEEFCAKIGEAYKYKVNSRAVASTCPGVNEPRDPTGYARIPFTLEFYPDRVPDHASGNFVRYTFDVSPDVRTPVWFPLRGDNRTSSRAPAASPKPAARPATPAGPPKPRQADTLNATLLGNDVVSRDGSTWYFGDGTPVAGGAKVNLSLFDRPAEYTAEQWNAPLGGLWFLIDPVTSLGSKSRKTQARIWPSGRLLVFEEKTNGPFAVQTAQIQDLDLQKITCLSTSQTLRVPCAVDAPCVYWPVDGTAATFLALGVDGEQGRAAALAAFRKLRGGFSDDRTFKMNADVTCDCTLYPGHSYRRFIRATKTFEDAPK